jgi:hypothetical protein
MYSPVRHRAYAKPRSEVCLQSSVVQDPCKHVSYYDTEKGTRNTTRRIVHAPFLRKRVQVRITITVQDQSTLVAVKHN